MHRTTCRRRLEGQEEEQGEGEWGCEQGAEMGKGKRK